MGREERRSERSLVLQPIEFFLAPSIIEKTYDRVVTAISDSGLWLFTKYPLKDRQRDTWLCRIIKPMLTIK